MTAEYVGSEDSLGSRSRGDGGEQKSCGVHGGRRVVLYRIPEICDNRRLPVMGFFSERSLSQKKKRGTVSSRQGEDGFI